MNVLTGRSRADEVARLLDGPGDGAPVAALAGQLRRAAAELAAGTAPRADFQASLRTRLLAVASVQAHADQAKAEQLAPAAQYLSGKRESPARRVAAAVSWTQGRPAQRGLGLAAGALASLVAVAGVAVASSRSLPGDPFYGLKRGVEAWELHGASGDLTRGTTEVRLAAERLGEIRALTLGRDAPLGGSRGTPDVGASISSRIRSTLRDMDSETSAGSALLTHAYRTSHAQAPLQVLNRFAGRQARALHDVLPDLPPSVRPRAQLSLALVSSVGLQARQLLAIGQCTAQCSPTQAAPALPLAPTTAGGAQPAAAPTSNAPCGCSTTSGQPAATAAAVPPSTNSTAPPGSRPSPAPAPRPSAASTTRNSSPAATSLPHPAPSSLVPVPVPVPALPVPVPTSTSGGLPLPGATRLPAPISTVLPAGATAPAIGGGSGLSLPGH